ncbi:hypothetical protein CDAR_45971 [Caerostris darwini]|uniref:Uncharacterized protein n=1 Tax=Caerostris darwini TaxID=1538125 RepID=A0AAV4M666_9ARAC|nr:hypothetical protein CDAR_45971 [Caerostris darwini]
MQSVAKKNMRSSSAFTFLISDTWGNLSIFIFFLVLVSVEDGLSLGLMIRGGAEYGLGIYITGVDDSSAAHHAGLQVRFLNLFQ